MRDLNGFVKPDRSYAIDAIYDHYRNDPSSGIDSMMFDALTAIARKYRGEMAVEAVLDIVNRQLGNEKSGDAPFTIDCQAILDALRPTLIENKEMYLTPKESFDFVPFWNTVVEVYDRVLKEKYGCRVL